MNRWVLRTEAGDLLKVLGAPSDSDQGASLRFGWHRLLGWISEDASLERLNLQARSGRLRAKRSQAQGDADWICRFEVVRDSRGTLVRSMDSCRVFPRSEALWDLHTPMGTLQVAPASDGGVFAQAVSQAEGQQERTLEKGLAVAALLACLFFISGRFWGTDSSRTGASLSVLPVIEPVTVRVLPERQKAVAVVNPISENVIPQTAQKASVQTKRAIAQNLGFLGMLGSANLNRALGGATTGLNGSAGAGRGGQQGSGGELLAGLGAGVKRTTVGNSGVAGLGGVGTKGAGGGQGGYGNAMVGSGEGRALSSLAASQDLILEGGLDRAVIQATIAKYLSQVRACYEQGLAEKPGIQGTVSMSFQVGPAGQLDFAKVAKSSLGHEGVERCISKQMMGWKFPKPLGGVAVQVQYPFLLRPVGG